MSSRRFLVTLAIVPLLLSVHVRRAGADSECDQECDHEPGLCENNSSDDCYAKCETARDEQLSHSTTPPPPSSSAWQDPPPPPPDFGDDDAGAAFDASLD